MKKKIDKKKRKYKEARTDKTHSVKAKQTPTQITIAMRTKFQQGVVMATPWFQ